MANNAIPHTTTIPPRHRKNGPVTTTQLDVVLTPTEFTAQRVANLLDEANALDAAGSHFVASRKRKEAAQIAGTAETTNEIATAHEHMATTFTWRRSGGTVQYLPTRA